MCLYIKKSKHIFDYNTDEYIPLIAKEDMIVYKILDGHPDEENSVISPFRGFRYILNTPYNTNIKHGYDFSIITEGFHSFLTIKDVMNYFDDPFNGFFNNKFVVYKCIIPKGSEYFLGKYGDIASDNIFITDESFNYTDSAKKLKDRELVYLWAKITFMLKHLKKKKNNIFKHN